MVYLYIDIYIENLFNIKVWADAKILPQSCSASNSGRQILKMVYISQLEPDKRSFFGLGVKGFISD